MRTEGHFHIKHGFNGEREGKGHGNRTVAGDAGCNACGRAEVSTNTERFNAFVHITKPLFEPHHCLAICSETEMTGLDDAGVNGTDGNLVQAFALNGKKRIGLMRNTYALSRRPLPGAMIEPVSLVGQVFRNDTLQFAQGAFRP